MISNTSAFTRFLLRDFFLGIGNLFLLFRLFNQRLSNQLLKGIVHLRALPFQVIIPLKMRNIVQFVRNVSTHKKCVIWKRAVRALIFNNQFEFLFANKRIDNRLKNKTHKINFNNKLQKGVSCRALGHLGSGKSVSHCQCPFGGTLTSVDGRAQPIGKHQWWPNYACDKACCIRTNLQGQHF